MHVCAEVQSTGTGIITGMLFLGETQRCSSWLCGTLGGVVAERAPRIEATNFNCSLKVRFDS